MCLSDGFSTCKYTGEMFGRIQIPTTVSADYAINNSHVFSPYFLEEYLGFPEKRSLTSCLKFLNKRCILLNQCFVVFFCRSTRLGS